MTTLFLRVAGIVALFAASATSASAAPVQYIATLRGANIAPPNGSPGTGVFTLQFDLDAHMLQLSGTFNGLATNATSAHLHCCSGPGANAGVAVVSPYLPGFPLGFTSGVYATVFNTSQSSTYSPTFLGGGPAAAAEALLANGLQNGTAYLDIHSINFPGGEIRGQVLPVRVFGSGFE